MKKYLPQPFSSAFAKITFLILGLFLFKSCGQIYFPIELKTLSRTERFKGQEDTSIELVSINKQSIKKANLTPYKKRVIDAGDLNRPAQIIPAKEALKEVFPVVNDPGPYIIGNGDELTFAQGLNNGQLTTQSTNGLVYSRKIIVADDGFLNLFEIGRVKAFGLTQSQLEDEIYTKLIGLGKNGNFELAITGFNSKRVFVSGDNILPKTVPYTNTPIYLEDVLMGVGLRKTIGSDAKITIIRDKEEYVLSLINLAKTSDYRIRLFPNDKIFVSALIYRNETVLLVGETGAQIALPITSYERPTLADTLFSGGVLNRVTSDFSQIYVLREKKNKFLAYHLDITKPSRIKLAKGFEMRPDDIVFVATQPLSLYSRTLSQILGSTGLTLQARDTIKTEIGN